jgi:hypothetical protein
VGDMQFIAFAKHSVEQACGAEQAHVAAMQWRKRPATHITTLVEEDSAGLAVGRRRCWRARAISCACARKFR